MTLLFQTGFAYFAKKSGLHMIIITLNLIGWMVSQNPLSSTDDRTASLDKVSLKPEQTFNYRATTTYTYNHGIQPSQQR